MTASTSLAWGRTYLMCRPSHFRVHYAINPWMDLATPVDTDRAEEQWQALAATLRSAGAAVEEVLPRADSPDMVYAMNYGLVDGDRVVLTRFRHPERRAEIETARQWFAARGLEVIDLPDEAGAFEAGDAFLFGGRLLVAAGPRTDETAHAALAQALDVQVQAVPVVHPALYHLDLSFCPLDDRRAIVAPSAWSAAGRRAVADLVAEPLVIDEEEAFTFCANSVVVGTTVVMPAGSPTRVLRVLERWGFEVVLVDVSELHKGGGSARCMTLPLDTRLDAARLTTEAVPVAEAVRVAEAVGVAEAVRVAEAVPAAVG